jgi:tetratricopeptide (TPR) repeat protein
MGDRLRVLWDFDDLDGSERRLREQLEREETDGRRAEVLTQLARVEGLRGDFARCAQLLDEAEALGRGDAIANVRLRLERGRMFRSSGEREAAFPLFRSAFDGAVAAGDEYLAGDAAHMCAIAVDGRAVQEEWTQRGLDVGDPYWAGPLLNNLGWSYFEDGDYGRALDLFRDALAARRRDPGNVAGIAWAHYALAQALRMLGRGDEAVAMAELAARAIPAEQEFRDELAASRAAAATTPG